MITLSYILMGITILLIIGSIVFLRRNRIVTMALIGPAILTGVGSYIAAHKAINSEIPKKAYDAVAEAAQENEEVDVVYQIFIEDKIITNVEYGQIAEVYYETTGKDLNEKLKGEKP